MTELVDEWAWHRLADRLDDPSAAAPDASAVRAVLARAARHRELWPQVLARLQRSAASWLLRTRDLTAARGARPTPRAYRALCDALDRVAHQAFACAWLPLAHWCAGVAPAPAPAPREPPAPAPREPPAPAPREPPAPAPPSSADPASLSGAARAIAAIAPSLADRIELLPTAARPRTKVYGGGVHLELRGGPSSVRGAFTLLHELGHAAAALVTRAPLPRAVDEAAAAWMARHLEQPGLLRGAVLPAGDYGAERARRAAIASYLAAIEASPALAEPLDRIPWALWHDPGAQAAYLAAEAIADAWWEAGLRWAPPWPAAEAALAGAIATACREAEGREAPVRVGGD